MPDPVVRRQDAVDFDRSQLKRLRPRHRAVLKHNVREFMVTPSDELYGADGNTWGYLWDTMFAVMAIASDNPPLAGFLLQNYLKSQHANGMIPHMVMWSSGFPQGWLVTNAVWQGYRHKGFDISGHAFSSSAITQPPLMAVAAGKIVDSLADDSERAAFSRSLISRLIAHHTWLYRERELNDDGLVVTVHPHETGRDDAPSHVRLLRAIPWSLREKVLLSPILQRAYERSRTDVDQGRIELGERSTTDTTLRSAYVAMFDLPAARRAMRRSGAVRIPLSHPYLHFDPGFNAILDRANSELIRLAEVAEATMPPKLLEAITRTASGLQGFWSPADQCFRGIDAHGRVAFSAGQEIGDILPIYSDHITGPQVHAILDLLIDPKQFGGAHLPSVNRSSPDYNPDRFWTGPAWPPTTELTIRGLLEKVDVTPASSQAVRDTALHLLHSALLAAADGELPEYRNSLTGEARGARQFTWTAALTINLLDLLDRRP
jgi:hypothetical protein